MFKLFDFWAIDINDYHGRQLSFTNISPEVKYEKRGKSIPVIIWSVFIFLFLVLPAYAYISASNKGLIPAGSVSKDYSAMLYELKWISFTAHFIGKWLYFYLISISYAFLGMVIIIGIPIFLYYTIEGYIKKRIKRT